MSRPFVASLLFLVVPALPLLVVSGRVVAGPPEKASGKMVLDQVEDGLRQYQKAKHVEKRVACLRRLIPYRDPRAAVVMGEALSDPSPDVQEISAFGIVHYFCPEPIALTGPSVQAVAKYFWEKNKAELRRRAKQLPQ
jgi:hypothetical protein